MSLSQAIEKEFVEQIPEIDPAVLSPNSAWIDAKYLLLLLGWTFTLNVLGLGDLEFFRHTEADRTLIGWEMLETGDFLVPHLLGSVILTKPPLFYWLMAGTINVFGTVSEFIARMPSVLASVLFVLAQYLFWRRAGFSRELSLLSALCLSTSVLFFVLGAAAEIDMVFSMFCAVALYSGYFSIREKSLSWTIFSYLAASFAFLTKGPPVVFFLAAALLGFFLWQRFRACAGDEQEAFSFKKFVSFNFLGVLVFFAIIGLWLSLLANRVGWDVLWHQFDVEVLKRVVSHSDQGRGVFFYFGALLGSISPWSVFLLAGAFVWFPDWRKERSEKFFGAPSQRAFFVYSLIVLVAALLMLSIASGKSSRYVAPVLVFAVNLSVFGVLRIRGTFLERLFFAAGRVLSLFSLCAVCVLPFVLRIEGVSAAKVTAASLVFLPVILLFWLACAKQSRVFSLASIVLIMFAVRFGQCQIYTPYRNATRSVQELALRLHSSLPSGMPVYTLEMAERWVCYYLKHLGRESFRLTPENAYRPVTRDDKAYLLLSFKEESWRLTELSWYDESVRVVEDFTAGKTHLLLVEVEASALSYLKPREVFPTSPTKPFYGKPPKSFPKQVPFVFAALVD